MAFCCFGGRRVELSNCARHAALRLIEAGERGVHNRRRRQLAARRFHGARCERGILAADRAPEGGIVCRAGHRRSALLVDGARRGIEFSPLPCVTGAGPVARRAEAGAAKFLDSPAPASTFYHIVERHLGARRCGALARLWSREPISPQRPARRCRSAPARSSCARPARA